MKNRILFFNTEQKHTVLCNLTCKKVASRQMKQLKELQPSDPPLLPNTATGIPTEPAMMQNLLVKSLPVESPVNMHMPHLVSEQIWAHLFIHYRQMLTEGKLKATCVSPAVDITESTQENTSASPKKPEGMKRCIAGEEAPWSAWHLSAPVNEDHIGEYLSATYFFFLTCWKVMWRREQTLNAFTHLQLLGNTFPWDPRVQYIHLTLRLAFWKENSLPGIRNEKTDRKIPIDTLN